MVSVAQIPVSAATALFALALTARARADWDFGAALRALGAEEHSVPRPFIGARPRLALVVEHTPGCTLPPAAIPINGEFYALYTSDVAAPALLSGERTPRAFWSPPRRLLLDRAGDWTRASPARARAGVTGQGVLVGILDTGVDVLHPDLRNADGSSRVRWLIDFTRGPLGRHAELEEEYGCLEPDSSCAVYSSADLDELIANGRAGDEPRDAFGHGTHVASLAVGNGRGSPEARFVGVAPEAGLVVARLAESGSAELLDADILRGARFVFERAGAAGAPAVLNLSLGSDFGAHDGNSALERALASFVGADQPGRAIVVAAGNSAALYANDALGEQGPFGVHTTLHIPESSSALVPLLMVPSSASVTLRASAFVWVSFREGDALSLGLELDGAPFIKDVAPGHAVTKSRDELAAVVANGVASGDDPTRETSVRPENTSAVVLLSGSWPAMTRFHLRFSGQGTASLWVQGTGALDPARAIGAVFPFATKEGTINIPASAPELIAVGATLNRIDWTDALGDVIVRRENGAESASAPDSIAYFSSAGPNALGATKPDLVAPGMNVIGAMSSLADPRHGALSLFTNDGRCPGESECFVADDGHAVASGTSMAAPLVAGAIALLFEKDPGLTQEEVRALLLAGTRPLEGSVFVEQQAGLGALDLEATLAAQGGEASATPEPPSERSSIELAASYAHPDPAWPLEGHLRLRARSSASADGFEEDRLALQVDGGRLADPLRRIAPGLYRFSVVTPRGSGGGTLRLRATFDGAIFAEKSVPIAVDPGAKSGAVSARGGCAVRAGSQSPSSEGRGLLPSVLGCALLLGAFRLRQRRAR